jgi:hypothetical protein
VEPQRCRSCLGGGVQSFTPYVVRAPGWMVLACSFCCPVYAGMPAAGAVIASPGASWSTLPLLQKRIGLQLRWPDSRLIRMIRILRALIVVLCVHGVVAAENMGKGALQSNLCMLVSITRFKAWLAIAHIANLYHDGSSQYILVWGQNSATLHKI